MWIMTHFGILMPSLRPEGTFDPVLDTRHIQIRARRRRDLDYLRTNYAPCLGPTVCLGDTDYQYRAYCTHVELADICGKLAMEIDYTKFKPTTDRHKDDALHNLYNRIWSCVINAFPVGAYGDWNVGKAQSRKLTRAEKRAAKRQAKLLAEAQVAVPAVSRRGWRDDGIATITDYDDLVFTRPEFRKRWWEDEISE